jgi:hypothetical protein
MERHKPGKVAVIVALLAAITFGIGAMLLMNLATAPGSSPAGRPSGAAEWTAPPGGITREEAIEIATGPLTVPTATDLRTSATATFDVGRGRWVWDVSWMHYGGPTGSTGCEVIVDFFSGEVLGENCWVS